MGRGEGTVYVSTAQPLAPSFEAVLWWQRCLSAPFLGRLSSVAIPSPSLPRSHAGIVWLQRYLTRELQDTTLVMVSHDRAFLNAVAQEIIVMKDGALR